MNWKDNLINIISKRFKASDELGDRVFLLPNGKFVFTDKIHVDSKNRSIAQSHYTIMNWICCFVYATQGKIAYMNGTKFTKEEIKELKEEFQISDSDLKDLYNKLEEYGEEELRSLLETELGCIRLNGGATEEGRCITLPIDAPNPKQYDSLLRWLDKYFDDSLMVESSDASNISYKIYDPVNYISDDIIKEIKKFYLTNNLC